MKRITTKTGQESQNKSESKKAVKERQGPNHRPGPKYSTNGIVDLRSWTYNRLMALSEFQKMLPEACIFFSG